MKYLIVFLFPFLMANTVCSCELIGKNSWKSLEKDQLFIRIYQLKNHTIQEYTGVFSSDTQYQFLMEDDEPLDPLRVKVSILNEDKEVIMTNDKEGELLPKFIANVDKTGIYYFRFELLKGSSDCGAILLSTKKK